MLLELPYPKCRELQNTYVHLKDLNINDHDPKSELPVHVILGISDYTKTTTQERPRVGLPVEPIAELTISLKSTIYSLKYDLIVCNLNFINNS